MGGGNSGAQGKGSVKGATGGDDFRVAAGEREAGSSSSAMFRTSADPSCIKLVRGQLPESERRSGKRKHQK